MMMFFKKAEQALSVWRWKYFTPDELKCKQFTKDNRTGITWDCSCGGSLQYDEDTLDKFESMREEIGPVILNSFYRCEKHNKNQGGTKNSYHRKGQAGDVRITKTATRAKIHAAAKKVGFNGILDYNTFVHVDTRPTPYYEDKRK